MKLVIEIDEKAYEQIKRIELGAGLWPTTLALYNSVQNGKPLPKDATNGDMIKTMFPDSHIVFGKEYGYHYVYVRADCEGSSWKIREEWWNAPYKANKEG